MLKEPINKLSDHGKRLYFNMRAFAGRNLFDVNDFRKIWTDWRYIQELFMELESRGLGKVLSSGAVPKFILADNHIG